MSLRLRVLVGMALIAVVLAVAAVVITRTTEDHLIDGVDAQLAVAAGPLERAGGGHRPDAGSDHPGVAPADQPERLSPLYEGVVAADGTVRTDFAPNLSEDTPLPAIDGDRAVAAAAGGEPYTVGSQGSDLRYRVLAGRRHGSGEVFVVALPLADVDAAVDRLVAVEAAATLVILGVLGLVAWWVVHLGIRPLKEMTASASAIAAGDLSRRVPEAPPHTEAGQLGVALNQMLARIEAAFDARTRSEDRLRQFLADASHELRTPVTTIRGYAELYQSGGLIEEADVAEAMRRTGQEAVRMGNLIDDMLLLARLDQGRPFDAAPVDVALLAADAARDAGAVAPGREVTADTDGPLVVSGDSDRLRQVLANVVGNALVHTPPDAPVDIDAHRSPSGDLAVIEITDHGQGMPADAAERAFERFYRADRARSRHRGGTGLGLTIVKAIVTAHGGTVALSSRVGEGTTVRISLPLAPTAPA